MPIRLEEKEAIVAEVNETATVALSAVMADYRGVPVDNMTTLRQQAREAGVQVKVIRNTLAKRAFQGTEFECLNDALLGPNILAFSFAFLEGEGKCALLEADTVEETGVKFL